MEAYEIIDQDEIVSQVDHECKDNDMFVEDEKENSEKSYYYWDNDSTMKNTNLPMKIWHWSHWMGIKTFQGMEFSGEVLAHFFGLTRSKYQWVLDAQYREEEDKKIHELEESQRKQLKLKELLEREKKKLQELEQAEASAY